MNYCDNCQSNDSTVHEVSVEGVEVNALLCDNCLEKNELENLDITTCGHDTIECPNHEGNFDCNPFCALCEGDQEYCPTCEDPTQAEVDAFIDTPTREDDPYTEAWLCFDCAYDIMSHGTANWSDLYDIENPEAGIREFSKSPCPKCEDALHGTRYLCAFWGNGTMSDKHNNKETN